MRRTIVAAALAASTILGGAAAVANAGPSDAGTERISVIPRRPCPTEDWSRYSCFWDAGERGNHQGHSFWVHALHGENRVCRMYLSAGFDRNHGECWKEDLGPRWHRIPQALQDAFAEGEYEHTNWKRCWMQVADTTTVACYNGVVFTS